RVGARRRRCGPGPRRGMVGSRRRRPGAAPPAGAGGRDTRRAGGDTPPARAAIGRVLVIVPTSNERETLPRIVARLRAAVPAADVLVGGGPRPRRPRGTRD